MMIRRTTRPRRSAATVVETAAVLSVFLVFILGVIEYGRFLMVRQLLDNAAREGARQAVVSTNTLTTADVQNIVQGYLAGQMTPTPTVQVYKADPATGTNTGVWTDAAFGDAIAVQVTGTYKSMVPSFGFLPTSLSLTATAMMRSEAN